jgi:hypothetical protein
VRFSKVCASIAILAAVIPLAQTWGADAPEQCAGADSWKLSHPEAGDGPRVQAENAAIANAGLLSDLRARVEEDQAARKRWLADPENEALAGAVNSLDAENLIWLQKLIAAQGFPKAAQVGKEGVHLAWVLLQHADQDPKLQRGLLPVLTQRHAAGELPANDLARLSDRVLLANGEPQKYGTQFDWFAGDFKLPEPTTLAAIDASRAELGLMPLADYVCTIRKSRANAMKEGAAH